MEAKDRVGGRLLTVPIKVHKNQLSHFDLGGLAAFFHIPIDFTGQWVGKKQLEVLQLAKELGIETYDQYTDGHKWGQFGQAKPRKYDSTLPLSNIRYFFMIPSFSRFFRQFSISEILDFLFNITKIEGLVWKVSLLFGFDENGCSVEHEGHVQKKQCPNSR